MIGPGQVWLLNMSSRSIALLILSEAVGACVFAVDLEDGESSLYTVNFVRDVYARIA